MTAVQEVQVFSLRAHSQFRDLTLNEKRYTHHFARAAWLGSRIVLRQVSPESLPIFDFILELYHSCSGKWSTFVDEKIALQDVQSFLAYAATFLSNVGNYYGSGDQKFLPGVDAKFLENIVAKSGSAKLRALYESIKSPILAKQPSSLGYGKPDSHQALATTQTTYYLGGITKEEVAMVSSALEAKSILPENTRIKKKSDGEFEVLLASTTTDKIATSFDLADGRGQVTLVAGDHSVELKGICAELAEAAKYAANDLQREFIRAYIKSFETGDLETYKESLKLWVSDKAPRVENIFGFVEPYRDPYGVRAEFEGLVGIADDKETELFSKLVENSDKFIRQLPWASPENNGKGPFEKNLFEPPDVTSIYTVAYCSSIIFPGINLPNYNDIRESKGSKSVIIANRMAAESQAQQYPFIDLSEAERFRMHKFSAYYWWVVLHELLGHGTGRMMVESEPGKYNFDIENPPINPVTGRPIASWYKPGQTWTSRFGDLATTVDECRAELVGAYLMDDPDLLKVFGFTETSEIRAEDVTYNLYQQLGVDGLRGLSNYDVTTGEWGQAHSRAHFSMLKNLLRHGDGVILVTHDKTTNTLRVQVNRSKIRTHGKPALSRMLLQLHMFRCTADSEGCRAYYEDLSRVDGEYLEWRETVIANKPPPLIFVHANTFLDGDEVSLKEYEATVEGVVQSWADRRVIWEGPAG